MPAEENKALVGRVLAAVRHGWTPAVIDQFFAPDYRRHLSPTGPHLTGEEQRERASRDPSGLLPGRPADRPTRGGLDLRDRPRRGGKLAEEWGGPDQGDLLRSARRANRHRRSPHPSPRAGIPVRGE